MKRKLALWLVRLAARIDHQAILILMIMVRDDPAAQKVMSRFVVEDRASPPRPPVV